jgi:dinuclear metal center YbgI/SA1388 family protein
MTINKIIKELEDNFPRKIGEAWDNIGLLVGDENRKIEKIQIALDVTEDCIEQAIENKVNLLIVHHPIIFSPIKEINNTSVLGRKILKLIENNIAVYVLHTNIDAAKNGLNDYLGKKLGLKDGKVLESNFDEDQKEKKESGIGRTYKLKEEIDAKIFLEKIKNILNLDKLKVSGELSKKIKKIAIINGAGASYWRKAKFKGCDILITGDVKYHEALDAKEEGLIIADVGHYESEIFFIELIYEILKNYSELNICIYKGQPLFKYY